MKHKLTPEDRDAMMMLYVDNAYEMLANATIYRRLFEERSKGDYDIFTIFERETVEEYLEQATQFVQAIEQEIKTLR